MLDKAKVRKIAADYSAEVKKVLNPEQVILFGSYVNGEPHEWSDIDIAVLIQGLDGQALYDTRILLQRLLRQDKVFFDIEPHLLDKNNDTSGFVEYVIKTGEVIA